jgi:hypothetical protein
VLSVLAAGREVLPVPAVGRGLAACVWVARCLAGRCFGRDFAVGVTPSPKVGGVRRGADAGAAGVDRVWVRRVVVRRFVCPLLKSWRVASRGMAYCCPAGLPGSTCTPPGSCAHAEAAMGPRLEAATQATTADCLRLTNVSMPEG